MSVIKNKTYNIYMMPGMAANSLIFERIKFPENYIINYLEWLMPIGDEELSDYVERLSKSINGDNIVLIGVSFGGIIVQEIAKIIKVHKIVIISSVKKSSELPFLMHLGKNINAHIVYDDDNFWPLELTSGMEKFISSLLKVRRIKFPFLVKILNLLFLTISTPTPKIFMLLNDRLKFFNYILETHKN